MVVCQPYALKVTGGVDLLQELCKLRLKDIHLRNTKARKQSAPLVRTHGHLGGETEGLAVPAVPDWSFKRYQKNQKEAKEHWRDSLFSHLPTLPKERRGSQGLSPASNTAGCPREKSCDAASATWSRQFGWIPGPCTASVVPSSAAAQPGRAAHSAGT